MVTCTQCNTEFEQTPWQVRWKDKRCKKCCRAREKAFRDKRRAQGKQVYWRDEERHRAWWKQYQAKPEFKKHRAEYMRQRRLNPEQRIKDKARGALNCQVALGKIVKPTCTACGSNQRIEGHHVDYAKPLDVIWFCRPCHRRAHGRIKRL